MCDTRGGRGAYNRYHLECRVEESPEVRLQEQLRAGSAQAWQALYDLHAERLWRAVARLMNHDPTEVADVVQETFMAAARAAHQYDAGRGTTWAWLWAIARNQLALYYRKSLRLRELQQAQMRLRSAGSQGHACLAGRSNVPDLPPALAEQAETRLLIRATLAQLDEPFQSLLIARYLEGESAEQIGQTTGQSPGAVRSQLVRARQVFRAAFERMAGRAVLDDLEVKP